MNLKEVAEEVIQDPEIAESRVLVVLAAKIVEEDVEDNSL